MYVVRASRFSHPVVISAMRDARSKRLSDDTNPRTTMRTFGPLEEDYETSVQTSP